MLEKFLGEEAARKIEAGLLLLSLYDNFYTMISEARRIERLAILTSNFLLVNFDQEISKIHDEISKLSAELLDKGYGDPKSLEERAREEEIEKIKKDVTKVRETAIKIRERLKKEIELSLGVLAGILERYPHDRRLSELRFLSYRLRELSKKVEFYIPPSLDLFVAFILSYLPKSEWSEVDIRREIEGLRELLRVEAGRALGASAEPRRSISSELMGRMQDLIGTLDYLEFYYYRYPTLLPGIMEYLKEIKAEVSLIRQT